MSTSIHPKVALISSGLGNTSRGFEISTARLFKSLRDHSDLNVELYCGGDFPQGKRLWNFPRNSIWTRPLSFVPFMNERHRWEWTYGVEQVSFWSALNFELLAWKPDVVWVKDVPLVHLLMASRVAFGLKYKLIFANGGSFRPSTYKDCDQIQQIQSLHYEEALEAGIPPVKMELIANCMPPMISHTDRQAVRCKFGFAQSDWLIVCNAAWNKYHKRIDYLIDEVARIADPNVKLLLCGTAEVETRALQELAARRLNGRVTWLTVDSEQIPEVLHAGDVFVLASLNECFGNALVEAAMAGKPIVTHPHQAARAIIRDEFWMADLSKPGNLAARLLWLRENPPQRERLSKLSKDVSSQFSEELQAAKFENMVLKTLSRAPKCKIPEVSSRDN